MDNDLTLAAMHVSFELEAAVAMFVRLHWHEDRWVDVALLEAHLMHTRNLIEFFLEGRRGTIHCSDFLDQPWTPPRSPAVKRLRDAMEPINQYVAHLDRARSQQSSESWHYPEIADDLIFVMAQFVGKVEKAHPERTLAFEQTLRSARGHMAGALSRSRSSE
jgi:hypothetical protein